MASLRVLVVDDDRDVAESLGLVLEGLDCDVELAFNGDQAIEMASAREYDLTLLDVRMPGRSGVEVFDLLRALRPGLRVAFVTGYGSSEALAGVRERGALDVLDKPVDIRQLRHLLTEAANR